MQAEPTQPLNIVCCNAPQDNKLVDDLDKHLSSLKHQSQIVVQRLYNIDPGQESEKEIHRRIHMADIILLLVSKDFIADDRYLSILCTRLGKAWGYIFAMGLSLIFCFFRIYCRKYTLS